MKTYQFLNEKIDFEVLKKNLIIQWSKYFNKSFEIEGKERGHIEIVLQNISNNGLCDDRDYQIKLYRKHFDNFFRDYSSFSIMSNIFSI